jgi:hypothetical protein
VQRQVRLRPQREPEPENQVRQKPGEQVLG